MANGQLFSAIRARVAAGIPDPLFYRLVAYLHSAGEVELRLLRSFVPPDKVAVDVGAWYGPWTYWLSRVARHVETFEPVPDVAEFIRRVAPVNVHVSHVALSDHVGEGKLFVPTGGRGTEGVSSLHPPSAEVTDREPITVPLQRLDDFEFEEVGFVKIDVEGHELAVLSGARELLDRQRPTILVEIEQRLHDEPIEHIFDVLTSRGYEGFFYSARSWNPISQFDVNEHQLERLPSLGSGFIAHSLLGHHGYVNNFLFTMEGAPPPDGRTHVRGDSRKSVR